jgi:hypothetical protein
MSAIKDGWEWWFIPVIPSTWEAEIRTTALQWQPKQKCKTLSEKQTKGKRSREVTQVIEHLPSKCEA